MSTRFLLRLGLLALAILAAAPASAQAARYVSPNGSDGGACTAAAPCQSFNRAYAVAAPGEVVTVAGGTYGGQRIDAGRKASGPRVVFQPAPGAAVSVGEIDVYANHIEFRNLTVRSSTYNREGSNDIAYVGVHMRTFLMRGASNISYIRSNVGPNSNADEMNWISAPYQSSTPSRNILFDGTVIHDFVKHNDGAHIDCIGIDDVDGLTIRNSVFRNCEHFSLLFGTDASTNRGARNVLLENNFLDCCVSGYYSIGFGQVDGPMVVRHNSTNKPFGWLGGPVHNVTIDSNVLANNSPSNCDKADWSYNVVRDGSPCSGNGMVAEPGFRNSAAADLHLVPGAAAIDRGNPAAAPARDIDGQSRTGNRPDAGADEANPTGGSAPPAGSGGAGTPQFRQRTLAAGKLRAVARLQKMSLRRMIRRGLRLEVRCSAFCVVGAKARLAAPAARRLHIRRTLDRAHGRRATSGTVVLHLRPSARQAKRLRHLKKVRLTVRVGIRSRGGRTDRAKFRVAVRRTQ